MKLHFEAMKQFLMMLKCFMFYRVASEVQGKASANNIDIDNTTFKVCGLTRHYYICYPNP